jgi:isoleucyl-tRNA synthetase
MSQITQVNTENDTQTGRDWGETLYLPKTDFPMRAGLPQKEPELLARWDGMQLYKKLRQQSQDRPKYVLHDGPPYANGHLHIGHALNKILKDIITRSFQMRGFDSNYVPGWDCHGLPIEWKIEEQYRAKGLDKNKVEINEFRRQCREFAQNWIGVQTEEFRRLGVEGDFETPYTTMNFAAEAKIAEELHKFAMSGQLYRGSKPVMWSVVEHTALAEAEVEYQDYESDTVWVKFPVKYLKGGSGAHWHKEGEPTPSTDAEMHRVFENDCVVIWTTTPWTIPGNRAISFSSKISYGRYKITVAENTFGPQPGEFVILAKSLADECAAKAKIELELLYDVIPEVLAGIRCAHPFKGLGGGYEFDVPLFNGDHVTDEAGTGFVHTAPGHGREDFDVWMEHARELEKRGISPAIPFTVDDNGFFTGDAPGFGPDREGGAARVIDDKGKKGDANQAVISALIERNMLFARGRLKHTYPHSWRSKKPVIFRNTPQWFVYMDKELGGYGVSAEGRASDRTPGDVSPAPAEASAQRTAVSEKNDTLRNRSLAAINNTRFVPAAGQNRLKAMIETRPDWVLSRQRAWGVPIAIFADDNGEILRDEAVNARIIAAFEVEGADAWFAENAKARFLGRDHDHSKWHKVTDILDVWFDSGSTHAFCLEQRGDLKWPADLYLEGSDQHRGWFHSSLLESCGTRGRAPYDTVLTHGFVMDEEGRKMSKSLGNIVAPQDVIKQSGADILRLWVASADYSEDLRIGPEILKTSVDGYRKLRNTMRWMLGTLNHYEAEAIDLEEMPELERLMLHRLAELDAVVTKGYDGFDFKRIFAQLFNFLTVELSAFYFDIRKDTLYCDAPSSKRRKAALYVVHLLFEYLVRWLAPILPFTTEEAWLSRYPDEAGSVHMQQFLPIPAEWRDEKLAAKWQKIRRVRRAVTWALEIERREKRLRSSLEAAPIVYIDDPEFLAALDGLDFAEICITSQIHVSENPAPENAVRFDDVPGVAIVPALADGRKCARSWRILPEVGTDPDYPELSLRDADAMREIDGAAQGNA